jgi:hypothetical protein
VHGVEKSIENARHEIQVGVREGAADQPPLVVNARSKSVAR